MARYGAAERERLMADTGIVRNRAKIDASISNAIAYLEIEAKQGFGPYLWGFVDGRPIQNGFRSMGDIPAETPLARTISKDLRQRGFKFVGPTIVYAFMQAVGMVNDHVVACHRHEAVKRLSMRRR
jgi:DNA-3-methyladenine glycosylase I